MRGKIDFVLSMGDDISDEPMFKMIDASYNAEDKPVGRMDKEYNRFTCIVGRKPTHARYYVNDYKEALEVLRSLEMCSIKISRNKSVDNAFDMNLQSEDKVNMYSSPTVVLLHTNVNSLRQKECL